VIRDEGGRKWRKWSWPYLRYYPGNLLEGLMKITKKSIRFAGLRTDIWTGDLPNTRHGCLATYCDVRYQQLKNSVPLSLFVSYATKRFDYVCHNAFHSIQAVPETDLLEGNIPNYSNAVPVVPRNLRFIITAMCVTVFHAFHIMRGTCNMIHVLFGFQCRIDL
jgi:hypothetical protein